MNMSVKAALSLVRHEMPRERPSAAGRIYDDLRQRILSLDLPPGTNLLRAELARDYEVSQTPLRDALQRLEQDDLVLIFPQSRTLVTRIDICKVHEAHFLRVALETEVARHLARAGADDVVAQARSVAELHCAIAADRSQLRLFQELDEHFHRILFDCAGQDNLHGLIRSRAGHLDRVRRLQIHSESEIRSILGGHEAMMDAIEARDEPGAMAALRNHLHKDADWVDEFRARHPDYFA